MWWSGDALPMVECGDLNRIKGILNQHGILPLQYSILKSNAIHSGQWLTGDNKTMTSRILPGCEMNYLEISVAAGILSVMAWPDQVTRSELRQAVWEKLDQIVLEHGSDLWEVLQKTWEKITPEHASKKMISRMSQIYQAVIDAKGTFLMTVKFSLSNMHFLCLVINLHPLTENINKNIIRTHKCASVSKLFLVYTV